MSITFRITLVVIATKHMPVLSGDCCITGHWQNKPYPYAPYQGLTLGDGILRSLDMENEYWWVWLGIGVNLAYIFLMNVIIIICLAYLPGESCFLVVNFS